MSPNAYRLAPKVELHLHLEGAIPLDTLWSIVQRHGGDPGVPDRDALVAKLAYRDFAHFIEAWTWMTGFLRTPEDFRVAGAAVAASLLEQGIVYAEASISPSDYAAHGMSVEEIAVAVRTGIDSVPGARISLIVDLVRDPGPERAHATLDSVLGIADDAGIVGVTIGGSEQDHPPGPFAGVYRRARDAGLHLSAHAGEAAGPSSVWSAIRDLGVERIGHGVRSVEDPQLLAYLVEHQIPLEVCPTSNIRTGVVSDLESHPVRQLIAAGARVTISTDDPTFFHCNLTDELRLVSELTGVSGHDLTTAAIAASWLDTRQQADLRRIVDDYWQAADDLPGS
ncbi:MAG: adenosine deaminase [Acidimicrobiia bacterium]|nr:adenosine deaminase [Acidimicrobiia bacterium]